MQLVLSLFSGIGLLDRAFKEAGFCVVSAGDILFGNHYDIRNFVGLKNKFYGIILGTPCPDFSPKKRNRPALEDSYGFEMINEFKRVVLECDPTWVLLENVCGVPDVEIDGYYRQRLDINASWYSEQNRLRHIQFFHKKQFFLNIPRVTSPGQKESCVLANDDRPFKELVRLQGLEPDFDLPSFNVVGKKRAVGNGVPLCMGRVLASEVCRVTEQHEKFSVTQQQENVRDLAVDKICDAPALKICRCGCGRTVTHRGHFYDFSCRKRFERKGAKNA